MQEKSSPRPLKASARARSELHANAELKLPLPDDVVARGPDSLEGWFKGQRRSGCGPASLVHPGVQFGDLRAVEKIERFNKNLQVRPVHYPKPPRDPEIHIDDLRQPEGVAREQRETTETGLSSSVDARSQATVRPPSDTCRIRCSRRGKEDGGNGEAVQDCVRQLVIRPERCGRPDGIRRELVANVEIRRALISGQVKRIRRVVTAGNDRAERQGRARDR